MTEQSKKIRGTREWAVATVDCCIGCPHDCRYCYARYDAVQEKQKVTAEMWRTCRALDEEVKRKHPLYPGQVMFPANHDIVPEILDECLEVIGNLLVAGNRLLIVSKPHKVCIERICKEFHDRREQLLFRFTITARSDELLAFWEPGAPAYRERVACLASAHAQGFATSVSVEPILDIADVVNMVHELLPLVNHSIWLGRMNKIQQRVLLDSREASERVTDVELGQSAQEIWHIYRQLCDEPRVRWKESIKEVVGIALPLQAGLDT